MSDRLKWGPFIVTDESDTHRIGLHVIRFYGY